MSKSKPHPSTPARAATGTADRFARAVELFNAGQAAQAEALCGPIVQAQPAHAQAWQLIGMARIVGGRPADALQPLRQALALQPRNTQLLCLLGTACSQTGQPQDAVAWFDRALAIEPGNANVWYDRGNVLRTLGAADAALASLNQALAVSPQHADAWLNRGLILLESHRGDEAIASLERAVDLTPRNARPWLALGQALEAAGRLPDALACYEKVVTVDRKNTEGWIKFGSVLRQLGRPDLALQRFDQAAQWAPESAQVLLGRAQVFSSQHDHVTALGDLKRAYALDADNAEIALALLHAKLHTADWDRLPELLATVAHGLRSGSPAAGTFHSLAHPDASAADLLRSTRARASEIAANARPIPSSPSRARPAERRLRIGYLSSDLRAHPVTYLMAGVFANHDRERFETFAFSTYPQADQSPERLRVQAALDHFVDIHALGDPQAAHAIARHGIDVLVDLNGLTAHGRPGILAHRPAPIQVQYLGYPGTSGMPAVDYILGDRWVTPPDLAHDFSEHIVRLPDSFQANDDTRPIAPDTPSRAALGLPEPGFVFCCLNNSYKINPGVFDRWMRLLRQLPQAVLWLLGESETVRQNLRAEAQARGVAPERLVFAQRRPYAEYLAQYRQADLFLDTLPFNGGTTASDALWAGLPVLTQLGHTFAGRMAASLLDAVGLPELITRSADEYEALALRLAREPETLRGLRQRLAAGTPTAPLFDTRRFTRHLERAFEHMAWRHAQGLAPAGFDVAAD